MYFYLKEPKSNKETLIYIIYSPLKFKYSTGKKINPQDWNFENRTPKALRGRTDLSRLSLKLNQYSELLGKIIDNYDLSNKILTKEILKNHFNKTFKNKQLEKEVSKNSNISEVIDIFLSSKTSSKGTSNTWFKRYNNLKYKILFFEIHTKKKYTFKDLNSIWLDKYCGFLRDFGEILDNKSYSEKIHTLAKEVNLKVYKKGYNDNTLSRHIVFLNTFLNWVNDNYSFEVKNLKNNIKSYQPEDVHFNFQELNLLEGCEGLTDAQKKVRDIFLIGVYSGQRYSDYSAFDKSDLVKTNRGKMLIKRAEKTEYDSIIPLTKKLESILDKYDWKLPKISEQKFRDHLPRICKKAGIDGEFKKTHYKGNEKHVEYGPKYKFVGTHTARRTFITLSAEKGMPDHIIMKITGIRDVKTLHKYMKTSNKSVQDFMHNIWG